MANPPLYYVGDAGRYYPDLGLTPEPGQAYGPDTDPPGPGEDPGDGRWTTDADAAGKVAAAYAAAAKAGVKLADATAAATSDEGQASA